MKKTRVCWQCLLSIFGKEGKQPVLVVSVDETDKNESTCSWCNESGFDLLYEIEKEEGYDINRSNE